MYFSMHPKQCSLALAVIIVMIFGFTDLVFASRQQAVATALDYWYADDNIRAIVRKRLGQEAHIAPAIPSNDQGLIAQAAQEAINQARAGNASLIPVNLGNMHWTAIAIKITADGRMIVFYNDPLGHPIATDHQAESRQYIDAIRQINPHVDIIDLQVHQQHDSSSCGAFVAEDLIALAGLEQGNLTAAAARNLLSQITDPQALRLLHFAEVAAKPVVSDKYYLDAVSAIAFNDARYLASIISDRLIGLQLVALPSIAALQSAVSYGVWVDGGIGNDTFKSQNYFKRKQSQQRAAIGFDTKLSDNTVIGIALNHGQTKTKQATPLAKLTNNVATQFTGDTQTIIGSLYLSHNINDRLVLGGDLKLGKIKTKIAKNKSLLKVNNLIKPQGNLLGGSLTVNYFYPVHNMFLVPSFGISYAALKFKSQEQVNLKVNIPTIKKPAINTGLALTSAIEFNNLQIMPAIKIGYETSLSVKSNRLTTSTATGLVLADHKISTLKNLVVVGASLDIGSPKFLAGVGYERASHKKYAGNSYYGKLQVNF